MPAVALQCCIIPPIAHSIRLDLFGPPRGIRHRNTEMLRATMPKTPVDENAQLRLWKDEIGGTSQCRQWAQILSEPQATSI